MVAVVVEDNPTGIYRKMEARFRKDVPEAQMRPALDQIYAQYGGRPLEAVFKSEATGQKVYPDGDTKPLQRFWYAVSTTTEPMGKYFLIVEVVPDGAGLACAGFSIVSFPAGSPPWLN